MYENNAKSKLLLAYRDFGPSVWCAFPKGHSHSCGYGRLNARKAVELARPAQAQTHLSFTARQDVPITDLNTSQLSVAIADTRPVQGISVEVDIEHTYIGDLIVQLSPPAALPSQIGSSLIVLHNRVGGGQNNLKQMYDPSNISALQKILGQSLEGTWSLQVEDQARYDTGLIRGFTLKVEY